MVLHFARLRMKNIIHFSHGEFQVWEKESTFLLYILLQCGTQYFECNTYEKKLLLTNLL